MLEEKLKYAIHFCKSIDTDDYARIELRDDDFTIIDEIPDVINSLTARADQAAAAATSSSSSNTRRRRRIVSVIMESDDGFSSSDGEHRFGLVQSDWPGPS